MKNFIDAIYEGDKNYSENASPIRNVIDNVVATLLVGGVIGLGIYSAMINEKKTTALFDNSNWKPARVENLWEPYKAETGNTFQESTGNWTFYMDKVVEKNNLPNRAYSGKLLLPDLNSDGKVYGQITEEKN